MQTKYEAIRKIWTNHAESILIRAEQTHLPADTEINKIFTRINEEYELAPPELQAQLSLLPKFIGAATALMKAGDLKQVKFHLIRIIDDYTKLKEAMELTRLEKYDNRTLEITEVRRSAGYKGLKSRWASETREVRNQIIIDLAARKDVWGPIPAKELWPEYFARLDFDGLNPIEEGPSRTCDSSVIRCDGLPNGISFKTFENLLSETRNPKSNKK
ncbi:hypothetical protein [Zhongshania marina]|uniref:Uncharacterized protein n=1 Tax=Zhongshania marina TaxID=2304603 RepID=A0A2S4HH02_9GAMM|nr:hypothetical protein [Marortus luteolus]POP52981.1 hypothetical protein C0068_07750 [Marortus luteolus]